MSVRKYTMKIIDLWMFTYLDLNVLNLKKASKDVNDDLDELTDLKD